MEIKRIQDVKEELSTSHGNLTKDEAKRMLPKQNTLGSERRLEMSVTICDKEDHNRSQFNTIAWTED